MADIKLIVDTKSVDRAIDKIDRLRTGVGRTSKTTRGYTQATQQSTTELQQHTKATQSSTSALQRQATASKMGSNQFADYNTAVYQANQRTKRFASVGLQQAGYQVGDFAVQLQGGTNAAVAFGQQGSQLLGIFGAGGAIAGAALAITTAFVAPLLDAKKAAEDFETALQSMSTAVSSAKKALDLHKMSVVELADKYGLLAFEARQASVEIARADYRGALSDLRDFSIPILEDMVEAMELYNQTELYSSESNQASQQLRDIREELQLSNSEFNRLQDAYTEFQNASTLSQQVEAAIGLRDAFSKIPEEVLQSDKELNKMVGSVAKLFLEGSELKDLMSELENSAPGQGWMDDAIKGVNGLYNRIIAAISGVRDLKAGLSDRAQRAREVGRGRGTMGGPTPEEIQRNDPRAQLAYAAMTEVRSGKGSSGGGGGGMSAAEKQAQEFEKLKRSLDDAYASSQKFKEGKDILDKALETGIIPTTEEYKRLLGLLREEYDLTANKGDNFAEDMAKIAQKAKDAMGDAFMSIVDGSKSAGDAFKDMARLILKQAFDLLVVKPIMDGLFGQNPAQNGIGGLIGSVLGQKNGGAWDNGVQMFANGGVVTAPTGFQHSGGLGLMGEAGPEAIMPLKRGKNGKLGVRMEDGGQQPVVINQNFNFSANGDESVKRIIQQEAPKIANYTQQQIMDQRRRGGAMKSTFGG